METSVILAKIMGPLLLIVGLGLFINLEHYRRMLSDFGASSLSIYMAGTTALLLLAVFTIVNVAVLVLRTDHVGHKHFRVPAVVPILGAATCAFLVGPWTGRDPVQYLIAAILLAIGVALWGLTVLYDRMTGQTGEAGEVTQDAD